MAAEVGFFDARRAGEHSSSLSIAGVALLAGDDAGHRTAIGVRSGREALERPMRGRITLIIAHRL